MNGIKYEVQTMLYKNIKDKVFLPKFQRGFVWSKETRRELIKTIKKGLPIGTLLLSRKEDNTYLIVDGRQRVSTLKDYERNKSEYIEITDIDIKDVEKILTSIPSGVKIKQTYSPSSFNTLINTIRQEIFNVLKSTSKVDTIKYRTNEIVKEKNAYIKEEEYIKLYEVVVDFIDSLVSMLDVDNITLPVIIFESDNSDLIETFINLNQRGTKLSKYDIYSAAWQDFEITVADEGILNAVADKYKDAQESGLEIEGFDEDVLKETAKINVFEYAYSISKIIGNECEYIFKARGASSIDSLGFSLLSGIFKVNNKDMKDLAKKIKDSNVNAVDLKDKLIITIKEIEKMLRNYLSSPNNKTFYNYHSELQLASLVITYFNISYIITADGNIIANPESKRNKERFRTFVHKHYLFDILRGFWSGSGDTKLDDLVINTDLENSRYLSDISKDQFEGQLVQWFDDENSKEKINISKEIRLFLNYLLKTSVPAQNIEIDVDHIIPKSRLEKLKSKKRGLIPISTPSNLVMIPKFDNRSKRELTYYELLDMKQTLTTFDEEKLEQFSYPHRNEISFVESHDTFTSENYKTFIDSRKNFLINKLVKNLYNY